NGRGAAIDRASTLAREPFLVVAEVAGSATQGRIMLATPISLAEIDARFADRIEITEEISFEPQGLALRGRRARTLGAITLTEHPLSIPAGEASARTFARGIAAVGLDRLPWSKAQAQWRDRVIFLRAAEGDEWPDLSTSALAARVDDWLAPALYGK